MRRRSGMLGLFLAAAVSPACAQSTEAEKRKLLLPVIRSATDCIAREAARHPEILQGYRVDNLAPMIAEGWKACTNQLVHVVTMHDNLHGTGTGLPFVKGAYADDLPRAVKTRLKPDLDRRIEAEVRAEEVARAERARLEVERQANLERLERAHHRIREFAYECTTTKIADLIASAESADVLATASMSLCRREVDDAVDAALAWLRAKNGPSNLSGNEPQLLRQAVRTNVLTTAVQLKAAAGAPKSAAPTATPAVPTVVASDDIPKEVKECLKAIADARNGKFIGQRALFEGMLDLCRPEIEAAARRAFLAKQDGNLATEREGAVLKASAAAKAMIGMSD